MPSKKRIGAKRKRLDRGDPSDVDGYLGPWAGYVDEKKVAKPTEVSNCNSVNSYHISMYVEFLKRHKFHYSQHLTMHTVIFHNQ